MNHSFSSLLFTSAILTLSLPVKADIICVFEDVRVSGNDINNASIRGYSEGYDVELPVSKYTASDEQKRLLLSAAMLAEERREDLSIQFSQDTRSCWSLRSSKVLGRGSGLDASELEMESRLRDKRSPNRAMEKIAESLISPGR